MTRKLVATAGRKQVIGRPILYKTTKDFLLRFGLKDINELPSIEEFEKMAGELAEQEEIPMEHHAPETASDLEPEKDQTEPQADGDSSETGETVAGRGHRRRPHLRHPSELRHRPARGWRGRAKMLSMHRFKRISDVTPRRDDGSVRP